MITDLDAGQHTDDVIAVAVERDLDWRPVQRHDEIVRRHCRRNLDPHLYLAGQRQLIVGRPQERQRRRRILDARLATSQRSENQKCQERQQRELPRYRNPHFRLHRL